MEDYMVYECPKCQIRKQFYVGQKVDTKCKCCGRNMKYVTTVRKKEIEQYHKDNYYHNVPIQPQIQPQKDIIHCPKCNSTAITTGARGVNNFWGFIGASKTVNRCGNCGYTWKPNGR